ADPRYVGLIAVRQAWDGNLSLRTQVHFDYFKVLDQDTLHINSPDGTLIGVGNALHLAIDTLSNGAYAWYGPNGGLLSDSSSLVIDPVAVSDAGWYHVSVSTFDCQLLADSILVDVSTGVTMTIAPSIELQVFPSPASDQLHMVFRTPVSPVSPMRIFDAVGRAMQFPATRLLMAEAGITGIDVSVAGMTPGTYFIELMTEYGKTHAKFLKE
ncbi:MAG TPA: T9SS type A sorting domain-containing protein, partial [Flavobacteriales bacterium]|nr:T9SS type A sorting domain-containing protein [Flavobacteriales bacterium]